MGRRRQQKKVSASLAERFGQPVAARLAIRSVGIRPRQLVGFVENNQVKPREGIGNQPFSDRIGGSGVDADDEETSSRFHERIASRKVGATENGELEVEEMVEFSTPVPSQSCRRANECPLQSSAVDHLADVEPGHNRLAGAGVVSKKEAQRILG